MAVLLALCRSRAAAQDLVDLNLNQEDVRLVGDAGDEAGFAVASGDLNGDGLDDLIVGAYAATANGKAQAGKVYVVFGNASLTGGLSLSSISGLIVSGEKEAHQMGRAVASGDLNGDGLDDLIIGAPFAGPEGRVQAGKVYVVFGKSTGNWPAAIDLELEDADLEIIGINGQDNVQGTEGDNLGGAIAVGDIDADGVEDLIISATKVDTLSRTNAGATYVIFGRNEAEGEVWEPIFDLADTTQTDSSMVAIVGRMDFDESGISVASGDVNRDGFDDVIIGAPTADPNDFSSGEVYVVTGRAREEFAAIVDLDESADLTIQGGAFFDYLGWSVAGGDVNRDGFDDVIIGAPGSSPSEAQSFAGNTYVLFGKETIGSAPEVIDLSAENPDVSILGDETNDNTGWVVTAINYNGDGFDDLITAAAYASPNGGTLNGKVYGIFGDFSLNSTIDLDVDAADLTVLGDDDLDYAGQNVASGDVDGDGVQELIVGASGAESNAGEVYIIRGKPPYYEVSVTSASVSYNEPLPLSVSLDSTNSSVKIVDADLCVSFNPELLLFGGVRTAGTLVENGWTVRDSIVAGADGAVDTLFVVARTSSTPVTQEGTFLYLDFTVKDVRRAMTGTLGMECLSFNGGRTDWSEVVPGTITLTGHDGELAETVVSEPGDTVRVRVTDLDLNVDALAVDTVVVELTNSRTGELERLRLSEQSVDDGVFFGEVMTSFSGAPSADDGLLIVQAGDRLVVDYTDSLSAAGPEVAMIDTHWVLLMGDADANGQRQAFDAARILGHAIGNLTLTGTDSLAANLDLAAPYGSISSYDAALVIQRRLGLIDHFPVQEAVSANHPQPETGGGAGKPAAPEERWLSLVADDGQLVVHAEERAGIVSGDLVIEGLEGVVEMGADTDHFMTAYRNVDGSLRVAFAGERAVSGPGELFRITPTGDSERSPVLRGQLNGGRIAVLTEAGSAPVLPRQLALHPNTPNPFNAQTLIRFDLPQAGRVDLEVFNALGQKVRTLVAGPMEAGSRQVRWDSRDDRGREIASGLYIYRLTAVQGVKTRTMMLLK